MGSGVKSSDLGGGNELHGGGDLLGVLHRADTVTELLDGPDKQQHMIT